MIPACCFIEALLEDKSACIISIPYRYGEVRWLAAHALANVWAALGMMEPVRLQNILYPLDTTELCVIARGVDIEVKGNRILDDFNTLNEMGKLPLCNLECDPVIVAKIHQQRKEPILYNSVEPKGPSPEDFERWRLDDEQNRLTSLFIKDDPQKRAEGLRDPVLASVRWSLLPYLHALMEDKAGCPIANLSTGRFGGLQPMK
ncbi:hypothetical protein [Anthocerotibacter panamensis]|uniref:hypothetical protein n=1 Tax=Anthocerotibacter panamensis TaxID=2857077 RepID=UPI001C405D6B|nr:hypothetical protein [Anthocerotibacter panamensis]